MDGEQASLAFIYENIFRCPRSLKHCDCRACRDRREARIAHALTLDLLRAILPRMEVVMAVYIKEARHVWDVTRIAIGTWAGVDLSLLALLTMLTIAFLHLVHGLHPCFFAVLLAMSLPKTITAKLHAFYARQVHSHLYPWG
eukprot:2933109-Rhodomonas_salina.1